MNVIFITGAAGFIGSALCRYLHATKKYHIIGIDKMTYAASEESLSELSNSPHFELVKCDINDSVTITGLLDRYKPLGIIHLAAETHVDRSIDSAKPFIESNIVGTFTLLECARAYMAQNKNFRFHHVSTDEVFGSLGATGYFNEHSNYMPNSPYSASKAASDHLVRAWHKTYGLNIVLTNCTNNYGPYQFPEKLIPLCLRKMCRGEPLPIYGKGDNVRDWLYVEDHAEALAHVYEKGNNGHHYFIGGKAECSNLTLVNKLCALMDELRPGTKPYAHLITFVADRPGHDERYAMDISKIECELGWRPKMSLEDGLRKTAAWYLEHTAWAEMIEQKLYTGERLGLVKHGV
jgi:dTDP-glucose 4,6-dehydratase